MKMFAAAPRPLSLTQTAIELADAQSAASLVLRKLLRKALAACGALTAVTLTFATYFTCGAVVCTNLHRGLDALAVVVRP